MHAGKNGLAARHAVVAGAFNLVLMDGDLSKPLQQESFFDLLHRFPVAAPTDG